MKGLFQSRMNGNTFEFTLSELYLLIQQSEAMKTVPQDTLKSMLEQVQDPRSEKAQQLYLALLTEKGKKYDADEEFQHTANKIVTNLEKEIKQLTKK